MSIRKATPFLVPDGFYQIKEMPFIGSNRSTAGQIDPQRFLRPFFIVYLRSPFLF